MYAIMQVKENDKEEVLAFDGTSVNGRQIVVELARKSKYLKDAKDDGGEDEEEEKSKTTCKFYLEGRCNKPKGQCRFAHPKPCLFHSQGKHCKFGEKCKFAHITNKNSIGKGQRDGSVALLTTFLQALGLSQPHQIRSSRNG